jgi:hypothetical protein
MPQIHLGADARERCAAIVHDPLPSQPFDSCIDGLRIEPAPDETISQLQLGQLTLRQQLEPGEIGAFSALSHLLSLRNAWMKSKT